MVFVVLEALEGLQEVLAKGFPAAPLRLTFRGRLELPVKVENMATGAAAGALEALCRNGQMMRALPVLGL